MLILLLSLFIVVDVDFFCVVLFCFHIFSLSPFNCFCYCVCLCHSCLCVAILFEFRYFYILPLIVVSIFVFVLRFNFMEETQFTLFLAVEKKLRPAFDSIGSVTMSIVNPGRFYIGLREHWCEAVLRARLFATGADVSSESHILLKI